MLIPLYKVLYTELLSPQPSQPLMDHQYGLVGLWMYSPVFVACHLVECSQSYSTKCEPDTAITVLSAILPKPIQTGSHSKCHNFGNTWTPESSQVVGAMSWSVPTYAELRSLLQNPKPCCKALNSLRGIQTAISVNILGLLGPAE